MAVNEAAPPGSLLPLCLKSLVTFSGGWAVVCRSRAPGVSVVRRSGLDQEYITPHPEENGMIARFFLTLKQECV